MTKWIKRGLCAVLVVAGVSLAAGTAEAQYGYGGYRHHHHQHYGGYRNGGYGYNYGYRYPSYGYGNGYRQSGFYGGYYGGYYAQPRGYYGYPYCR